jgi:hypothetical protein
MKHAKVAGVHGISLLGTPIPLEDIWDSRSDSESLHVVRNRQQLIDGKGVKIGRNVIPSAISRASLGFKQKGAAQGP